MDDQEQEPPQGMPLFDAVRSREKKDEGITEAAVANIGWLGAALLLLEKLDLHEVTGEGLRLWLLEKKLPHPSKPNAWGAMTQHAIRKRLIRPSGRWEPMRDVRSHARQTPVYFTRLHVEG